ncbi:GtrA family protein [Patescibacteria group bacterium]|nr:GtrA family protein [Patescibacteria group bacterium]MBU4078190.1 GtrA family protein [Patescibacteria group bacterium]
MDKRDFKLGLLIGFLIGLLALPTLGNLDLAISFYYFLLLPVIFPFLIVAGLFVADLIGEKIKIIKQVARFVLVGALNTFIDFGIIGLLLWMSGINAVNAIGIYAFFKFVSFSFASINSYFWNKSWTFEKAGKAEGKEFAGFYLVTGVGALINVGIATLILTALANSAIASNLLAGIIAPFAGVLCGFVWNFLAYKFFIFKK